MTDMLPDDDFSLMEFNEENRRQKQRKLEEKKQQKQKKLEDKKPYLYVHVVKAKYLLAEEVTGSCDPYVVVRLGNYKETTRHLTGFEKDSNPEWNQVFAFSRDEIGGYDATILEVSVEDKGVTKDSFLGWVLYDLCVVPKREPSDSPLDPKWYKLEDRKGVKVKGELMLAVWWGKKADIAFPERAFKFVGSAVDASVDPINNQSKVYLLPRLWYLRVNVIAAKGMMPSDETRQPKILVNAILGKQILRTRISTNGSLDPVWNEELMFVVAEPFEEHLSLSVEDRIETQRFEVLGSCIIPLQNVDRRCDDKPIKLKWFKLQRDVFVKGQKTKQAMFGGMIHMRICLESGYHVALEGHRHMSDYRPTDKRLWKKSIGNLELGILSAHGLLPMKINDERLTTDAYCVAMYGTKWVRTRTIVDSLLPEWNERYTWEVFDPCTVITIGVFDNCHLQGSDKRIGKVRIRVSTLETGRAYANWYPLLVLHPSGVKKMGEIYLAVRFTCSSYLNMMHIYSQPRLPKMHYILPITDRQLYGLRHHAAQIVSMRLSRDEPPIRREIVQYMLDVDNEMWSMRRIKTNFFRITALVGDLIRVGRWSSGMYNWKNPINSVVHHIIVFILLMNPERILPCTFLFLSLTGIWNLYRRRAKNPPQVDTRLSCADDAHPDELDEEFDTFPTSRPADIIRMRYDRLRSLAGRVQIVLGNIATVGERLQSLLSCKDPRVTSLFAIFCLVAAIVLYAIPFYVVAVQTILYVSKLSRSKNKVPSFRANFFTRLSAKTDQML